MNVLVVGSGGREHALTWKLTQSPRVRRVWCAPGNAGIAEERADGCPVETPRVSADDVPGLLKLARDIRPDLVVVGPDNPLAAGIVDQFEGQGFRIWGPNQNAARFESSKTFAQMFMARHGIPTAQAGIFREPREAKSFVETLGGRCAVKADGLALGKGVVICRDAREASEAIDRMLLSGAFGEAGRKVVIQELLEGVEVSLHALCDGRSAKLFPTSQDHKQAFDGDLGPNTGGMGAYSPAPFLSPADLKSVEERVIEPWLAGCKAEEICFKGILYPGIMLTKEGPKVLEFNARFGDPETQVYLMRLENDLVDLIEASLDGTLGGVDLRWRPEPAVCVVMASGGYPGDYQRGQIISGLTEAEQYPNTKVFHAGTTRRDHHTVTQGGRVLGITALGNSLSAARDAAYSAVDQIRFDGAHYRKDIAAKALSRTGSARE